MTPPKFIAFGGDEIPQSDLQQARAAVLPICYENAVSYGGGARYGPLHLLNASSQLERLDEESLRDWGAIGIHTAKPLYPPEDPEKAVGQMQKAAEALLSAGKFLLALGGDHAVSIGPIAAAARRFPSLSVLQVDAHLDLRESWNGSRFNHACVMRRVIDDMKIPAVQVGIRAIAPEEREVVNARKLDPFFAHAIEPVDFGWIERVLDRLSDTVYLTLDLDGLDPAALPGTGTPEPGGLTYRQLVRLIEALGRRKTVVAADIVELAKIPGCQVSEYTAAKIAAKMLVHFLS